MNNNKKGIENPTLLTQLMKLLEKCKQIYQQKRVFNHILGLVMGELFAFGRHTITQLLLTLGLIDEDWSAWYRLFSQGRFDEEKTGAVMLGEMLGEVRLAAGLSTLCGVVSAKKCGNTPNSEPLGLDPGTTGL